MSRSILPALLLLIACLNPSTTWAQPAHVDARSVGAQRRDSVTARAMFEEGFDLQQAAVSLFNEGLRLEGQHRVDDAKQLFQSVASKYAAAALKFEESVRLDPTPNAMFNLAECHEWLGRPATAYAVYKNAAELASAYGDATLARDAAKCADDIADKRSFFTIHIAASTPGLSVFRNSDVVGAPQFDSPLPVDPGEHRIKATASGYTPFEQRITIGDKPETKTVDIPALEPAPTPPVSPIPPLAPQPPLAAQQRPLAVASVAPMRQDSQVQGQELARTNPWPWVLGGLGAGAVIIGGVSGALALHDDSTLNDACPDPKHCSDASALSIQPRRDFEWNLARIALPVGIVAVGASAAWLILGGKREGDTRPSLGQKTVSATLDRNGGAMWIGGRF